jgi:hypothetical protein
MQTDNTKQDPVPPKRSLSMKAVAFALVGLLGFVFYALYNHQVFPSASIDLKLSQKEAAKKSREFAATVGYDLRPAKAVTTFAEDDDAKRVLEFKLGIAKANQLMKEQVPVWLWRTRFCKELSKDELVVVWTTQGTFKSMFHTFENDKKLPSISQDEALTLAKEFIGKNTGLDLSAYELFDRGSETKPNRTDHHFVWRRPGYSESEFRIRVEVAGNQVATCRYWLSPTDTWNREYESIRQWNDLLGNTASCFLIFLIATTIGAFVYGTTQHQIRWRFTLITSGVVAALVLMQSFNSINYILDQYPTSVSYGLFLTLTVLAFFALSLLSFIVSVLIIGGAEVVYRKTRPAQTAMQHLFTPPAMAQKDWLSKTVMGYLLVGVMMFWVISYYKIGQHFGYFCPLGVDDYNVLGDFCPAINGALIGVSAAGLEELSCRVVGLGLLQKLTKNFWLANLVQAVIWGFAHSSYAQQPCYARGIELTVVGLCFGYIARGYGVLPCLIAHYLYDAFLTVEAVFVSHTAVLIVPSILVLLPFILGIWLSRRWSKRHHIDVEARDLTNAHESGASSAPEHPEHQVQEVPSYAAINSAKRNKLILLTLVCVGVCLIPGQEELGSDKRVYVNAATAIAMASKYLSTEGDEHKDYKSVAQMLVNPNTTKESQLDWQHVYEKLGLARCRDVYRQSAPGLEWEVRFFKPLDPRSYKVYLNGDGTLRAIDIHDLDEAPGAKLNDEKALEIAQSYLTRYRPDLTPFTLDTKTRIAQSKRVDYEFDFLVPKLAAADTPAVAHAELKGDKVSTVSLEWRVPDTWSWPRKQPRWWQQVAMVLQVVVLSSVAIGILVWSVHILRTTRVPWRLALSVGLVLSAVLIVGLANSSVGALMDYDTAKRFESFVSDTIAGRSIGCLLGLVGCIFLSLAACTALQNAFPQIRQQLHNWILLRPLTPDQKRLRSDIWIDAAISSYALTALLVALKVIQQLVGAVISPVVPLDIPETVAATYCTSVPVLQVLVNVCGWALGAPLEVIVFASIWRRFLKNTKLSVIVLAVAAVLIGTDSWYWQTCLVKSVFVFFDLLVIWYFVRSVLAQNSISYVFAAGLIACAFYLSEFVFHAPRIGRVEIGVLVVLLLAPAALAIIFAVMDRAGLARAQAPTTSDPNTQPT